MILISIVLSGCGVTPDPEPNGVVYRAFFIGVSKYENGWALFSPAVNTYKLENLFVQCKFGESEIDFEVIERLINYDATKANILQGILDVFGEADDNDMSYFYYSGHGGLRGGIPIITSTDYDSHTVITVHELEEHLSMIPGTKIIFLETCHAGNFIDKNNDIALEPFDEFSLDLLNKDSYQVLASSAGDEYTWDSPNGSYFCRYLIEGCVDLQADKNEDEIVDISELYQYIKLNVTKQTVQIYPEGSTFPVVEY